MTRILIVDDEPATVELLEKAVSLLGYQVDSALNGEDALASIRNHPPDLVLLDLMMPGIDGYEVLRRMRSTLRGEAIPVIVITASPDENLESKVQAAGGNACLRKPTYLSELETTISEMLASDD